MSLTRFYVVKPDGDLINLFPARSRRLMSEEAFDTMVGNSDPKSEVYKFSRSKYYPPSACIHVPSDAEIAGSRVLYKVSTLLNTLPDGCVIEVSHLPSHGKRRHIRLFSKLQSAKSFIDSLSNYDRKTAGYTIRRVYD